MVVVCALVTHSTPLVNGTGGNGHENRVLVDALVNSQLYQDYERAFSMLTGLPLTLQPAEMWQLPHRGKRHENALCALMAGKSSSCAACLQLQDQLCQAGSLEPQTMTCALGLSDSVVPVHLRDKLIGFLQTGQVFRQEPTAAKFEKIVKQAAKWGIKTGRAELKQAYFSGKVMKRVEYNSAIKLLTIFAEQLAGYSNQVLIQSENAEAPMITRARAFIEAHAAEHISLGQVAQVVNASTFYFCKKFKKVTGINFTDYVSRVRIERAKNLLLNPNLRVSEIAFEAGFQSLTHFNWVFRKVEGQSPTDYRVQVGTN